MQLTLEDATARLSKLVREKLGAELQEFRQVEDSGDEVAYVVRWRREGKLAAFIQEGTHRACLHQDGRSMLVWGHYDLDEAAAKADLRKRAGSAA